MKNILSYARHLFSALLKQVHKDKKWFLLPILIILLLTSILIVILKISSPVLPFIYPLF
ncbi:DUF5989 family protein [Bacteriovorax sp. Seq25_V]|uniref:DUF5989 family protein n=1 Tax=Bacteriovorax sp. Seq25_V TaxID=1201288 RepID=UPI003510A897